MRDRKEIEAEFVEKKKGLGGAIQVVMVTVALMLEILLDIRDKIK